MKLFTGYRPNPPEDYKASGLANEPDKPQYQGVVFDDGSVALRWMTAVNSTSLFETYDQFYQVHGHPEYGTYLEWLMSDYDGAVFERATYDQVTDW